MEPEGIFLVVMILVMIVVWFINGFIADLANGCGEGFWWGFWLGPLGIIIAAIKGSSKRRWNQEQAYSRASDRLSHLARLAPVRRKIVVHKRAPTQFRRVLDCPLCGGSIDAAGVTGECECPHCCGRIAV